MSTLNQIGEGLHKAWGSLTSGWRELRELAGDALTRFQPKTDTAEGDAEHHALVSQSSRWGLLAAEVTEAGGDIEVQLEVPGLEGDDFDIEVIGNVLVVRGEKKLARERTSGQFHVMERAYGRFERAIHLPTAVDDSQASAQYKRGVLTVRLPKREVSKSRRIEVTA